MQGPDAEDELDAWIAAPVDDSQSGSLLGPTEQLLIPKVAQTEDDSAELDALVGAGAAPLQEPTDQESLTDAYKRDVDSVMVRKTPYLRQSQMNRKRSFCQGRLGTNIRKLLKKRGVFRRRNVKQIGLPRRGNLRSAGPPWCDKTPFLRRCHVKV
jgi:hypothetical protein